MVGSPKNLSDLRRIEAQVQVTCTTCKATEIWELDALITEVHNNGGNSDWHTARYAVKCTRRCASPIISLLPTPSGKQRARRRAHRQVRKRAKPNFVQLAELGRYMRLPVNSMLDQDKGDMIEYRSIKMPGVIKQHRTRRQGRAFPHSRYHDPRGGRASALERNVLRYRAIEASLYLFYAAEIREFMLENVFPLVPVVAGASAWDTTAESRQSQLLREQIIEAKAAGRINADDASVLAPATPLDPKEGKKLRRAFGYAVAKGMFEDAEAEELMSLLQYRNEIAHRIHLVMADVTRSYWTSEHVAYAAPTYRSEALDRLRAFRNKLWDRFDKLSSIYTLSFDRLIFEHAERIFEQDLVRLDQRIRAEIKTERVRFEALRPELDLSGTELVDDLDPRAPWNFRSAKYEERQTAHLTPQGVEICYRLFDLGRSPLAVAYLMGISLRVAQNRARRWREAGGPDRDRAELLRHPGFGRRVGFG